MPREPVGVEQAHEQLEVLLLAVVRRGGEEEEVPGVGLDPLCEQAPLGLLDLAREQLGGELVGLVEDDEVPVGGVVEDELEVLVAAELVQAGDQQVAVGERVARRRALDPIAGQEREVEVELLSQLRLPLLDERPRGDDEAAPQVAANDELADEEPGHDRLAGAGVIGQEEAERLARQHRLVDGGDLVRQRLDEARADRDVRVEEVGEIDPLRLAGQLEGFPVAVEGPGLPFLDDRQARLVLAVDEALGHGAVGGPVGQRQDLGAVPADVDDRDRVIRCDAGDEGALGQVLEPSYEFLPLPGGAGPK